ncbi:hypothetical protein ACFVUS_25365 [Nocardia sp. NPDC058058]|uniref:hypothetical protein n=1 Tax=Nocardia sp. NPDC058058 TaxID=3346317 RepID=UPI0036DE0169
MSDLLDSVIEASGGLDRWNEYTSVTAHLSFGGALFAVKGQSGYLDDINIRAELHRQSADLFPFRAAELSSTFTGDHIAIVTDTGDIVTELADPRASFTGHTLATPWDPLQTAYFLSYAMWNYLNEPFLFTTNGFHTEELTPWIENGQTWRRLKVMFPNGIATHSPHQTLYYDERGLLRRHDYTVEIAAAGPTAHYTSNHKNFDGITVPTTRRVYPVSENGRAAPEPLMVSVDIDNVVFA